MTNLIISILLLSMVASASNAKKSISTDCIYEDTVLQQEELENIPDPDELEELAIAIYQEGGGDAVCDECRYRIGDVILNRVSDKRFPDTIHGVLTQKAQYGRFHWAGVVWPSRASHTGEKNAVDRAYETAWNLLTDIHHSDLYGNGYIWQAEFKQGTDSVYHCGIYFGK